MSEDRDPLIDSALEEMLGGIQPQDLSQRILLAVREASDNPESAPAIDLSNPISADAFSLSPTSSLLGEGRVRTSGRHERSPAFSAFWTLGVLAAGVLIGLFALKFGQTSTTSPDGKVAAEVAADGTSDQPSSQNRSNTGNTEDDDRGKRRNDGDKIVTPSPRDNGTRDNGTRDNGTPVVPFQPRDIEPQLVRQWQAPESPGVVSETEMVAVVNRELARVWETERWEPGALISDAEWVERVLDRVFGLEPEDVLRVMTTMEELSGDRLSIERDQLLDKLFENGGLRRAYVSKWSGEWVDHLMLTALERGSDERGMQLRGFLRQAIAKRMPLGEWPQALLAAKGTIDESSGAGAWLLGHADRENLHMTSAVGEVFLGQRIACARCHDSQNHTSASGDIASGDIASGDIASGDIASGDIASGDIASGDIASGDIASGGDMAEFWQLNAFFAQLRAERDGGRDGGRDVRLVDRDMNEDAIFYELPGGFQKAAYPVFPDGQKIASDGRVSRVVRRRELGEWIGTSKLWHTVIVQRVWRTLLKSPLEADADVTAELVAQSTANEGHLESVIRWVVLSDAFCRPSHPADHRLAGGAIGMYRSSGQLNDTIDLLKVVDSNDGASILFARNVGGDGTAIAAQVISTIPLLPAREAFVDQIGDSELRWKERIDHLFLYAVGRLPLATERRTIEAIQKKQSDQKKGLKTIMEVLSNSADGDSLLD